MQITPGRVVAFLTPVFTAVSAVGTGWLAKHFPGLPHLSTAELVGLEGAGATAGLSAALKWLHGSSVFEREYASIQHYAEVVASAADKADPGVVHSVEAQTEQVVEAAKTKLIAVLSPAPADPTPAPAPAVPGVPVVVAPVVAAVPDPVPPAA